MNEVTQAEFFRRIGPMDVNPHPVGRYPYKTEWRHRSGDLIGLSVPSVNEYGQQTVTPYGEVTGTKYFLWESKVPR